MNVKVSIEIFKSKIFHLKFLAIFLHNNVQMSKQKLIPENLEYSLELLREKGLGENNIAFVTNSFHIFRATQYASQAGFNNINALSVKTDRAVFLPAVIREVCAVAAQMFFKY